MPKFRAAVRAFGYIDVEAEDAISADRIADELISQPEGLEEVDWMDIELGDELPQEM